jgi:glycerophosphoryl diester phosphodiesterase
VSTSRRERLLAIAHRSGNTIDGMRAALAAGVDLVEADVHAYRGRLEVRHLKTMGGLPYLWDRGQVIRRRDYVRVELSELVSELNGDARLMIDLKGVHPQLAGSVARVLREIAPDCSLTVCTKHWGMLDAFDVPVRRVLSASNRAGLARLRRRVARAPVYGVSVQRRLLSPAVVADLQRSTEVVMTWPVDDPAALADARRLGVDGVISKDLTLLTEMLAQRD